MAALAPLVGEMLGVERALIEVRDDGLRHSVRVGDAIDFEIEDIVPFGVEDGRPIRFDGMFHPVGSDLTMAEAKRKRIDAFGIEYEGKTGLSKSGLLLGSLSRDRHSRESQRRRPGSGLRRRADAARASSRCWSRWPRSAGGGPPSG